MASTRAQKRSAHWASSPSFPASLLIDALPQDVLQHMLSSFTLCATDLACIAQTCKHLLMASRESAAANAALRFGCELPILPGRSILDRLLFLERRQATLDSFSVVETVACDPEIDDSSFLVLRETVACDSNSGQPAPPLMLVLRSNPSGDRA